MTKQEKQAEQRSFTLWQVAIIAAIAFIVCQLAVSRLFVSYVQTPEYLRGQVISEESTIEFCGRVQATELWDKTTESLCNRKNISICFVYVTGLRALDKLGVKNVVAE